MSLLNIFNIANKTQFPELLIPPLFATILSILLVLGIHQLGKFLQLLLRSTLLPPLLTGITAAPFLISPSFLFPESQRTTLELLSITLVTLGLFFSINKIKNAYRETIPLGDNFLTFVILATSCWLLSIFPFSDADSVAYHLALPIQVLKKSNISQTWLHAMLSGYGELYSLMGLSLGVDNLNSILQASLFLVAVRHIAQEGQTKDQKWFLTLFFFSLPILLFLIPNQKLQLVGIMAVISFALILPKVKKTIHLFELSLLASLAVGIKVSFAIDLVAIALSLFLYRRDAESLKKVITIGAFGILGLSPLFLFKSSLFGSPFAPFHLLFRSSIEESTLRSFLNVLKIFRDSPLPFPISLLIPASPGYISTIIGLPTLFIFLRKPKPSYYFILSASTSLFMLCFSQHTTRFFIVPIFFSCLHFIHGNYYHKFKKEITVALLGQSLLVSFIALISSLYFSPSLVGKESRKNYYHKFAYGYQIAEALNEQINPSDYLLLEKGLRVHAFLNVNYAPDDTPYFLSQGYKLKELKDFLKSNNVFYAATTSPPKYLKKVFAFQLEKSWKVQLATRNPFNKRGLQRTLRIYRLAPL